MKDNQQINTKQNGGKKDASILKIRKLHLTFQICDKNLQKESIIEKQKENPRFLYQ